MVCFKMYRQFGGNIVRVTYAEASKLKQQGKGIFAPKHWYKAAKLIQQQ